MGRFCRAVAVAACAAAACAHTDYDERPAIIHARFDPDAKAIPMPNDAARDAVLGRLDLPNDTEKELARLTEAEREFYAYLETLDGWSSLMSATVEFDGAIDPATVTRDTVQLWHWSGTPALVEDIRISVSPDGTKITLDPPREGWAPGDRYFVALRGGSDGVAGAHGERVECDAAFYFLRQTEALDTLDHERAFPGDTAAERRDNAKKLEKIRADIAPMFDRVSMERDEVAALWAFTVTTRTELAMDKPSQRMPLPINLVLDPDTGHVDLPLAPWDSVMEAEVKTRLREYTGFGLSSELLFELTAPVDPATFTSSTVRLFELGPTPRLVPATVALLADHQHVTVNAKDRLAERTTYLVVVDKSVRDAEGRELTVMPAGHLLAAHAPVWDGAASLVTGVEPADAHKLENGRAQIASALDAIGRDRILAAWPFTTLAVSAPLVAARDTAARVGVSPDPHDVTSQTPGQAVLDFPLAIATLFDVDTVYHGTIESPYFLDPITRSMRGDGGHRVESVKFTLATPKNPRPGPMPVVIFGHGLVTERRFVLAVANALAARGFASISIDFPFHGARTYCATGGPISVVNPSTGQLQSLNPCQSGTTCNTEGRCVDASGTGNFLAKFPLIDLPVASGAVFTDVDHIVSSKDHFWQALVDLGALERSLRTGAWQSILGRAVDPSRIYYAGQSLGGIMGGLFLGTDPAIKRAVLNVPGANMIRLFDESTFFGPHIDALFTREHIARDSFEGHRFLAVASWVMDAVDPRHLGPAIGRRDVLIQMATLDFIIPNDATRELQEVSGALRRDYVAEHAFITVPVEPEYFRGCSDLAKFLNAEGL